MKMAAFYFLLVSIMLNVSTGLVVIAFNLAEYGYENVVPLSYDSNDTTFFKEEMSESVNPTNDLEDTGDAFDRLLDKLGLGIISKFLNIVDRYMFGIVNFGDALVGKYLEPDTREFLFGKPGNNPGSFSQTGMLHVVILLSYIIGAIFLWTGKNVIGDS